jgi:hypothetical protein
MYERLLVLYPQTFRSRFGQELIQYMRDERMTGRRTNRLRIYTDLVRGAAVERTKEAGMRAKGAALAFVLVAVAGGTIGVVGVGGGTSGFIAAGVFMVFVAVLYGIATLVSRTGRGAEYDYAAPTRRWWWAIAGLLGAAELFMGVGQLIDDPKKENVFALAIFTAFAALVFGGMFVRNRVAGNWMIATGALPMVPWFWMIAPPILALVVIVMALSDNIRMARTKLA